MHIEIYRDNGDPPFVQVRSRIATAIRNGELPVGERLPTVRSLADQLGLAPGTIARAYRELEAKGLVDTRGRHGTYVADPAGDQALHRRELAELAGAYARTASRFGIPAAVAIDLIDHAMRGRD
jgi:DNA-binding transcriptional regulator YhcF (GntR family)